MKQIKSILDQGNFLEASFLITATEDVENYLPLFLQKNQEVLALELIKKIDNKKKKAFLHEKVVRSFFNKKQFSAAFEQASLISDIHLQVVFFIDFFDALQEKNQHDKVLYFLSKMQDKKIKELIAKRLIRFAIDQQNLDFVEEILNRSPTEAPWQEKTALFVSSIRKKSFKFEPKVLQIVFKEFPQFKHFIIYSRRISDWLK